MPVDILLGSHKLGVSTVDSLVLGTAENFVPRYVAVFRLRTAVLYRGIPRLDQNI